MGRKRTRDVLEMSTVLQPGSTSRDVIRCALALNLDQNRQIGGGLSVPRLERREELETFALGVNSNLDGGTVSGRSLESVLSGVVAARGEFVASGVVKLEGLAISAGEGVRERVESEVASESHGGDDFRGSDESVGSRVSIVTASEVTVVRGNDYRFGLVYAYTKVANLTHWS